MQSIIIQGLSQNNLKGLSFEIPKKEIVVFTGVSGSGKSSIVFESIAAEAQRQLNETYPAFVRSRLPKYEKPNVECIENLSPVVVVDQAPLGDNARSTVGTVSELYNGLRLLFSKLGQPYVGSPTHFSFNHPSGMCPVCSGLGKVTDIDIRALIDRSKSLNEGALLDSTFKIGSWYWKKYAFSGLWNPDKALSEYTELEWNTLLYGKDRLNDDTTANIGLKKANTPSKDKDKELEGIYNLYKRRYLLRNTSTLTTTIHEKAERITCEKTCPSCQGRRLNRESLACWIQGYDISMLCTLELPQLLNLLKRITVPSVQPLVDSLCKRLTYLIDIGLPYLNLNRATSTLSGGESQRLKLVRFISSSLTDMIYIFDEPSTGLHPRDVYRMNHLLEALKTRHNTVLVVEHDPDVIRKADTIIDVGPYAGKSGGEIVFQGNYAELLKSNTLTGLALRNTIKLKTNPRKPTQFLPIRGACLNNLKNIDVDIPLGVICVITGVAGSGKSSLISGVFAKEYASQTILIDQTPITARSRSTPASYLDFFDSIRKILADENKVQASLFSFNSTGACPTCHGKGEQVTELVYMDSVTTVCETCNGTRYNKEALSYLYRGKNILQILQLSIQEALEFFEGNSKELLHIRSTLQALIQVGLSYLTLGQPLSTLSGGERQRFKLAKRLKKNGSIYIFDEPTTGLHPSDCEKVMALMDKLIQGGNSVLIIEHNLDIIKQADYIIDIGPDAGNQGGELVFAGTPSEMLEADTITAYCLRASVEERELRAEEFEKIKQIYPQESQQENPMFQLFPIGRIMTEENTTIILDKKYIPALLGLEPEQYINVYWWFDGCDNPLDRGKLQHHEPYTRGPQTLGTFATRAPERPNPIAVTTAQITWIDSENAIIGVSYLDALPGTPVLDIKPYTPSLDRVENPVPQSWTKHWPKSLEDSANFDWEKEFNFKLME